MVANGNRRSRPIIVWCDEFAGLLNSFERDGHESARAFYLTGWSVTNHLVDRLGRGSLFCKDLAISIFGAMTPGPFQEYVREAAGGADADGFLQRLQLAVYPDQSASWRLVDRSPDRMAEARALALFERLFALDEDDAHGKPPALHFAPDAQEVFERWLGGLEHRIAIRGTVSAPRGSATCRSTARSCRRSRWSATWRAGRAPRAFRCRSRRQSGPSHGARTSTLTRPGIYSLSTDDRLIEAEMVRRMRQGSSRGREGPRHPSRVPEGHQSR